jgi:hypothetical protein
LTLAFHQHNNSNTTTAQNSGTTVRNDNERGIATQQRVQDEKMSDSKTSASASGVTRSLEEDSPASAQKRVVRPPPDGSVEYEHEKVLCFAARNRRGRFYIPSKDNVFGGMVVENVLPLEWRADEYNWVVSFSRGTGAVHSPVLKISMHLGLEFSCSLGGKEQPRLKFLRFHMGSKGINHILETPQLVALLDPGCVATLIATRNQLAGTAPERTYALLGQSYLQKVIYAQSGDLGIFLLSCRSMNESSSPWYWHLEGLMIWRMMTATTTSPATTRTTAALGTRAVQTMKLMSPTTVSGASSSTKTR